MSKSTSSERWLKMSILPTGFGVPLQRGELLDNSESQYQAGVGDIELGYGRICRAGFLCGRAMSQLAVSIAGGRCAHVKDQDPTCRVYFGVKPPQLRPSWP